MKTLEEMNEASFNQNPERLLKEKKMKAIQALTAFEQGFKELVKAWEDDEYDIFNDYATKGYPFKESLDDLYKIKVKKWIQSSSRNILLS